MTVTSGWEPTNRGILNPVLCGLYLLNWLCTMSCYQLTNWDAPSSIATNQPSIINISPVSVLKAIFSGYIPIKSPIIISHQILKGILLRLKYLDDSNVTGAHQRWDLPLHIAVAAASWADASALAALDSTGHRGWKKNCEIQNAWTNSNIDQFFATSKITLKSQGNPAKSN